jgi:hypothetical protein
LSDDNIALPRFNVSNAVLDSASPYIWLPEPISDSIAHTFNSNWSSTSNLYDISEGSRKNWRDRNLQVSFEIANQLPSNISVGIMAAEWLPVTFRDLENNKDSSRSYLPINRLPAGNNQVVFGRPFFQAACMLTKYETQEFQITPRSQHRETNTNPGTFIPVRRLQNSTVDPAPNPKSSHGASIKRTVIEAVLGATALVVIIALFLWGRKQRKNKIKERLRAAQEVDGLAVHEIGRARTPEVHEVEGSTLVAEIEGSSTEPTPDSTRQLMPHDVPLYGRDPRL